MELPLVLIMPAILALLLLVGNTKAGEDKIFEEPSSLKIQYPRNYSNSSKDNYNHTYLEDPSVVGM